MHLILGWINAVPPGLMLGILFVQGAIIGSFLNVCIYRLPLEKSIIWPKRSYCGHCYQAIRGYDNIPLLSYWLLKGRCRTCGAPFSMRYFWVELFSGAGLALLFYFDFYRNGLGFQADAAYSFTLARLVAFAWHALLCALLLVAALGDLDHQLIPLPLTVFGTVVGLIGATLMAWPWPYPAGASWLQAVRAGWTLRVPPVACVYPYPVWVPLPSFLAPGGNWQTGLATGLAGAAAGTLIMRAVRFLFGVGMGPEYMEPEEPIDRVAPRWFGRRVLSWIQRVGGLALGLGDADLMMMAGAFVGWQPIIVAFLIGTFFGLFFGLGQRILRGTNVVAFGPGLAMGVVATTLGWYWIAPRVATLLFNPGFTSFNGILISVVGVGSLAMMCLGGYLIRLMHLARR